MRCFVFARATAAHTCRPCAPHPLPPLTHTHTPAVQSKSGLNVKLIFDQLIQAVLSNSTDPTKGAGGGGVMGAGLKPTNVVVRASPRSAASCRMERVSLPNPFPLCPSPPPPPPCFCVGVMPTPLQEHRARLLLGLVSSFPFSLLFLL
jgi:hypothetical protein